MRTLFIIALLLQNLSSFSQSVNYLPVKVVRNDSASKIDIFIGEKFFTSYLYFSSFEKPILYPIAASNGSFITRGFPLKPRVGERVDHPHQVGMWFNYGEVNGLDFWNNSYAIPASEKKKYGRILHRKITETTSDTIHGKLSVELEWIDNAGKALVTEQTTFIFYGTESQRYIERITKLIAKNGDVSFGDNKEGLMALRVDRAFESPTKEPLVFSDASGKPTKIAVLDNTGVNGIYRCSSGFEGDSVWGKRNKWVSLTANLKGTEISLAFFDHPANAGYPAHAHARGYGLFAINNFGHHVFNSSEPVSSLNIEDKQSITMKYLFIIKCGAQLTKSEANKISVEFDAQ